MKIFSDFAEPSMMLVRIRLSSPKDPRGSVGLFCFSGRVVLSPPSCDDARLSLGDCLTEAAYFGAIGDLCLELMGSVQWQLIDVNF